MSSVTWPQARALATLGGLHFAEHYQRRHDSSGEAAPPTTPESEFAPRVGATASAAGRYAEAVETWNEAINLVADRDDGDDQVPSTINAPACGGAGGAPTSNGESDDEFDDQSPFAIRERALVAAACRAHIGEALLLGRSKNDAAALDIATRQLELALASQERLLPPLVGASILDARVSWQMARTLSLLGETHHLLGRAITAEGLFLSALDALELAAGLAPSSSAASTGSTPPPQVVFELSRTVRAYSRLLSDWERREHEAHIQKDRAASLEALLPRPPSPPGDDADLASSSLLVPLTAMVDLGGGASTRARAS
jgi:tetratricopeptide (TPR) repeat protein